MPVYKNKFERPKPMNFVAPKLNMPLFMVSRNPLKYGRLQQLETYITKHRKRYTRDCNIANLKETATNKKFRHESGFEVVEKYPYPVPRVLKGSRALVKWRSWLHAPNRYGTPNEPFRSRAGIGGAYWSKLRRHHSLLKRQRPNWKFYDVSSGIDILLNKTNEHKGKFLTNARERRATNRSMVSNSLTCYHNPDDPGPTEYHSRLHELRYSLVKPVITEPLNPHLFLRLSCIPTKPNAIHKSHISFLPGPGRYETRFTNICPCSSKLIYAPGLQLRIDEQKRLKFRRLPYTKIKARLYCSPDWRHVPGNGHRRLFKGKRREETKPKKVMETKKTDKQYKLYPDGRYILMITMPSRPMMTIRDPPFEDRPPKVTYNCIAKRVMRKQLRNNKKIAFLSGQERFKDLERPAIFTQSQLEAAKKRLPIERQLIDKPVMNVKPTDIVSKLDIVPQHMQPTYVPKLRKRLFKFLPLPGTKVLVTDSDIHPAITFDRDNPTGFYRQRLNERDFFRESTVQPMTDTVSVREEVHEYEHEVTFELEEEKQSQ